ncbi:MAG: hypothetical protein ACLU38_03520 [Dysosmobacter sp.]
MIRSLEADQRVLSGGGKTVRLDGSASVLSASGTIYGRRRPNACVFQGRHLYHHRQRQRPQSSA